MAATTRTSSRCGSARYGASWKPAGRGSCTRPTVTAIRCGPEARRGTLFSRAAIVALVIAVITAIRLAVLPQPPVPREMLAGGATLILVFFAVLGGFGWIEARVRSRA